MSEEIKSVHQCLAEAQAIWDSPTRDTKGMVGNQTYKYATLEQIVKLIQTHLNSQGCSITQSVGVRDRATEDHRDVFMVEVRTTLYGPGGDSIEAFTMLPVAGWVSRKQDNWDTKVAPTPQESGSAITYARRYALLGFLGLGQEDDDGALASKQGAHGNGAATQAQAAQARVNYPLFAVNSKGGVGDDKFTITLPGKFEEGHIVKDIESKQGRGDVHLRKLVSRPKRNIEEWTFTFATHTDGEGSQEENGE